MESRSSTSTTSWRMRPIPMTANGARCIRTRLSVSARQRRGVPVHSVLRVVALGFATVPTYAADPARLAIGPTSLSRRASPPIMASSRWGVATPALDVAGAIWPSLQAERCGKVAQRCRHRKRERWTMRLLRRTAEPVCARRQVCKCLCRPIPALRFDGLCQQQEGVSIRAFGLHRRADM